MTPRFWHAAVVALTACSQEHQSLNAPMRSGRVDGPLQETGHLRISYGRYWPNGGDVALRADGTFDVPADASAAALYLDHNSNHVMDRYSEPTANCDLRDEQWVCAQPVKQVTVQRSMTSKGHASNDSTFILLEDFDTGGAPVADSKICVEHRCTSSQDTPFMANADIGVEPAQIRAFSICGPEGFQPQDAQWTSAGLPVSIRIERPPALTAAVSDVKATAHLGLEFELVAPQFDRLLVWAGHLDPVGGQVLATYWTSETADVVISRSSLGARVSVPPPLYRICASDDSCEIVVQALKYWPSKISGNVQPKTISATEWRSTLDFRTAGS